MNEEMIEKLRSDLHALHDDWEVLLAQDTLGNDPKFLQKVATDIQKLDADATRALTIAKLKEQAQVVHYALSSPWGAPFVGETTLLDAAQNFSEKDSDSALKHLLSDFVSFGHKKKVPLFSVLDEITEELDQL